MKILLSAFVILAAAASFGQCCDKKSADKDSEFMAMAREMEMKADGKKACCKSTAEKPMAKGEKGCCNAADAPKPFKVFVAGQGYKFFGCKDSAAQGRKELLAKGLKVGQVQKTAVH